MPELSLPWLRVLSGLFVNLAAGWFGTIFITSLFFSQPSLTSTILLTRNLILGIVSLLTAVKIEEKLSWTQTSLSKLLLAPKFSLSYSLSQFFSSYVLTFKQNVTLSKKPLFIKLRAHHHFLSTTLWPELTTRRITPANPCKLFSLT